MRLCGSGKRCDFLYLRHRSKVDSLKECSFLGSGEHGMGLPKEGDLCLDTSWPPWPVWQPDYCQLSDENSDMAERLPVIT